MYSTSIILRKRDWANRFVFLMDVSIEAQLLYKLKVIGRTASKINIASRMLFAIFQICTWFPGDATRFYSLKVQQDDV